MEDDLITGLTRQVKEEVIENYLIERRVVELQREDLQSQADELRFRALKTGRRLNRLAYLAVEPEMLKRLVKILQIPQSTYWTQCLEKNFSRGVRFIRVNALTDKAKFRKLFLEAYDRLYRWMDKYQQAYEDLKLECQAVNDNIKSFQNNFDLLTILNFLKSLDTATLERKVYLGENFTSQEMASIDETLYLRPVSFESLGATPPLSLPPREKVEAPLTELAQEIFRKYRTHVKRLLR